MKILLTTLLSFVATFLFAQGKYPSILWEITKPGMTKPSYLFGTYHISNKGVFKLGDSLFFALQNVDIVAKEVNANTWQEDQFRMDEMEGAYNSYKGQLRDVSFTENTFKKTNTIEKLPALMALTPNFINYFLYRNNASNEGFEEEMYLDRFISSTGYKYGKEVKGLENYLESNILGMEGQKDADDEEKKDIKKIPGDISYREMNDKIYDGYLNNSLNAMDSFMIYQYQSEAYFKKFVVQRNYNQADSLDYYIKTGKSVFGAVGCAHLPGEEGVIEILRKKGYTLRPVELKYKDNEKLDAIKKMIVPMPLSQQTIDNVISVKAPGKFYPYNKTDILKTYGYVDMKNGAYYLIARLYNNAAWFNFSGAKITQAIDSLLFSSIKGNITSKKITEFKGMPCVDVVAMVKNKDVERYRMLVTPYEIIKIQVGGKNNYAASSFVEDFFSSVEIKQEQPLSGTESFSFTGNIPFHQWTRTSSGYIQNKQRYANYDVKNDQLNTLIKNILPEGTVINDSLISHLIRESVLLSEAYPKSYMEDAENILLKKEGIQTLVTKSGKQVMLKYIINYPVVYLLTSLRSHAPDPSFIQAFQTKDYQLPAGELFEDKERGFSVMLPFSLKPDSKWKMQTDRKRKEYEDNKDPNAGKNLFYYPSTYGNNYESSLLVFEDVSNMETVKLNYYQFDSACYYPGATNFWKKIMEKYEPQKKSGNNEDEDDRPASSFASSSGPVSGEKVQNIQYDTSSSLVQKVTFEVADSISKKTKAYQYILSSNKLYMISYDVSQKKMTGLQKMITGSFKPVNNSRGISIFQSSFLQIVNDYFKAARQKQPAVLSRMNNIRLGIANLKQADSLFQVLSANKVENNILRRKIMDMVSEGLYSEKEWRQVSAWFQSIYNNKKNMATLRSFALGCVISRNDISDARWLMENFVNTGNSFQKRYESELRGYLKSIYPKKDYLQKARLILKDKEDLAKLALIDSGYYSVADRTAAFTFYKKALEDETLTLQISQEKNDFLFNEKELDETAATDKGSSNFKSLLNGFRYFYSLNPKDPFFEDAWKKITASSSDEDILKLLDIMLVQQKPDYAKVNALVKLAYTGQKNIYEINKIFYSNKKYDQLPDSIKNKQAIARFMLLDDRGRYSKLDSLVFIGAEKYAYSKNDSVYFYKYIKERETNYNIAYIILDNENNFLKTKPVISFTSEQVSAAEPYSRIVSKLMRKQYTGTYFKSRSSFYSTSGTAKSLGSEE